MIKINTVSVQLDITEIATVMQFINESEKNDFYLTVDCTGFHLWESEPIFHDDVKRFKTGFGRAVMFADKPENFQSTKEYLRKIVRSDLIDALKDCFTGDNYPIIRIAGQVVELSHRQTAIMNTFIEKNRTCVYTRFTIDPNGMISMHSESPNYERGGWAQNRFSMVLAQRPLQGGEKFITSISNVRVRHFCELYQLVYPFADLKEEKTPEESKKIPAPMEVPSYTMLDMILAVGDAHRICQDRGVNFDDFVKFINDVSTK